MRKIFTSTLVFGSLLLGACGGDATSSTAIRIDTEPVTVDQIPGQLALAGDTCSTVNKMMDMALVDDPNADTHADAMFEELWENLPADVSFAMTEAMMADDMDSMVASLQTVDDHIEAQCGFPLWRTLFHLGPECSAPGGSPDSSTCFDPRIEGYDEVRTLEQGLVEAGMNAEVTFKDVSDDMSSDPESPFQDLSDVEMPVGDPSEGGNFQVVEDPPMTEDGGDTGFKLNLDG